MRRREFITLIGGAAAAWPLSTGAQPARVPRVGVLTPAQSDATPVFNGLRKGLRDLGYIEGQTIILEFRPARGNLDALPGLAAELVRLPVDVIVTDAGSATKAALDATRTIPIVMGIAGDVLAFQSRRHQNLTLWSICEPRTPLGSYRRQSFWLASTR